MADGMRHVYLLVRKVFWNQRAFVVDKRGPGSLHDKIAYSNNERDKCRRSLGDRSVTKRTKLPWYGSVNFLGASAAVSVEIHHLVKLPI